MVLYQNDEIDTEQAQMATKPKVHCVVDVEGPVCAFDKWGALLNFHCVFGRHSCLLVLALSQRNTSLVCTCGPMSVCCTCICMHACMYTMYLHMCMHMHMFTCKHVCNIDV